MNIENAESIFHHKEYNTHRLLNKLWIIKMYHNIYLEKKLLSEMFSEIMGFVRVNPQLN